ncbi:MAG: hypothetical protein IKC26_01875 [Clostridia bacterium]|nr:hypothetical protein [Clostridia bacterium]
MTEEKKKSDAREEAVRDVEKMVTVFVPGANEDDEDDLVVSINFKEYRIPKNRECRVPEHVAAFLKCRKNDSSMGKKYEKKNQINVK